MGEDKIIKYLKNEKKEKKFNRVSFSYFPRSRLDTLQLSYYPFLPHFFKFLNSEYHLKQKKTPLVFVYLSFFMTCEIYDIEVLKIYLFKFGKVSA